MPKTVAALRRNRKSEPQTSEFGKKNSYESKQHLLQMMTISATETH